MALLSPIMLADRLGVLRSGYHCARHKHVLPPVNRKPHINLDSLRSNTSSLLPIRTLLVQIPTLHVPMAQPSWDHNLAEHRSMEQEKATQEVLVHGSPNIMTLLSLAHINSEHGRSTAPWPCVKPRQSAT